MTIIEGNSFQANVVLYTQGTTFGAVGQGFTVTGGNLFGIVIDGEDLDTHHFTVAGNIDLLDVNGFSFWGNQDRAGGARACPICLYNATVFLQGNQAIGNSGIAYSVNVNRALNPILLQDNVALNAGTGFGVYPGNQSEGSSFPISDSGVRFEHNLASHCGFGFNTLLAGDMQNNLAVANSQAGFMITTAHGSQFTHNSAIANAGPGAIVTLNANTEEFENPQPTTIGSVFVAFNSNNFYGNDRSRPVLTLGFVGQPGFGPSYDAGPGAHCGVLNVGAAGTFAFPFEFLTIPTVKLQAAGNYWGAAGGPAPTGPGDMAGGACDQAGGVTSYKPFATTTFGIVPLQ